MNWYKKAQNTTIMYHNTPANLVPQILKEGLKINSPYIKSQASQWFIPKIYKMNPIFLTLQPQKFKEEGDITLAINTTGLKLVADIPSLTNYGAYYSEDEGMWFKTGTTPPELIDLEDEEGMIYYWDLLDPDGKTAETSIQFTQTAACMSDISPERIKEI
jgi:hypothetical protein